MSTARRIFSGALWSAGSQVMTVALQIVYAATTSRIAAPSTFGDYSVALTATGFITVLASGGLAQAVGRMQELSKRRLASVASFAALLGLASSSAALLLSVPLGLLWGTPGAAPVIALLSINALTAPLMGFLVGVLRRTARFRRLAIITLMSNLLGMAFGVAFVAVFRTAESLAASVLLSQTVIVMVVWWSVRTEFHFGRIEWRSEEIAFSGRIAVASLLQYASGNLVRLFAARSFGSGVIGQWNRAEVLATVPFQQLQAIITQVVYPEFRHDREVAERPRRVWADLVGLVAWVTWPIGAMAAVVLPSAIPLIYGPGWTEAATFAVLLAIAGGLQPAHMLLLAGVEALGRFRFIWLLSVVQLLLQALIAGAMLILGEAIIAVSSLLIANVAGHLLTIIWCRSRGLLELRVLAKHYFGALLMSLVCAATSGLLVFALNSLPAVWPSICFLGVTIGLVTAGYLLRGVLPPIKLARRYGLL